VAEHRHSLRAADLIQAIKRPSNRCVVALPGSHKQRTSLTNAMQWPRLVRICDGGALGLPDQCFDVAKPGGGWSLAGVFEP
jgi:hypothetical protein